MAKKGDIQVGKQELSLPFHLGENKSGFGPGHGDTNSLRLITFIRLH